MSRSLSSANLTEIANAHVSEVVMCKLAFDTPVYVHSGVGSITYDGNTYTGVGDFGNVSSMRESEALTPSSITLTLSGVNSTFITEALDAGDYGDAVTIYAGFRQDDGTLVADPDELWSGTFEYATISIDAESVVTVVCQHDLADIREKQGGRYSHEDQTDKYASDLGLQFASSAANVKLLWGGGGVGGIGQRAPNRVPGFRDWAPFDADLR